MSDTLQIEPGRIPMLVIAVATTAAWLLAMLAVRVKRQPIQPRPGPATSDLRTEPPALANMLVEDFEVEREAVPGTLLDLAARRVVDIEETGRGSYFCRLRRETHEPLAPYEKRVLQLLRDRAERGVVPAAALTTGPGERSTRWWRAFRKEVVADAQSRGLSRDLWDARVLSWLTIAAIVPAPFTALAFADARAAFLYGLGAAIVIGRAKGHGRQRHTPAGLQAASVWLGVRRYLRDDPAFPDLPPTAVAVWERYLAYGAALGAASAAVRALPMGADETRRAWSAYGGEWRLVRIRYPGLWPPAWGWRPWAALVASIAGILVAAGALRLAASIGWTSSSPADPAGLVALLRVIFGIILVVGVGAGLWSALTLARSVADLGAAEEVTGLVLRLREFGRSSQSPTRCYVAVDDGRSSSIRAWKVRPEIYRSASLEEYEQATAVVTTHLRYVRSIARG